MFFYSKLISACIKSAQLLAAFRVRETFTKIGHPLQQAVRSVGLKMDFGDSEGFSELNSNGTERFIHSTCRYAGIDPERPLRPLHD
jgi:hypothetical protein